LSSHNHTFFNGFLSHLKDSRVNSARGFLGQGPEDLIGKPLKVSYHSSQAGISLEQEILEVILN